MQKQVDIYMPRLDIPFKKSVVPSSRGEVIGIRKEWKNFCTLLHNLYQSDGSNVRLIEAPLWQITVDMVKNISCNADLIYIPHKMRENWNLDGRVLYYMQMVIPTIFSIDPEGWCASASSWPIAARRDSNGIIFKTLQTRINSNISKFIQPELKPINLPSQFVFFPCQIPHDETIRFHSDVSVENSLRAIIESLRHFPKLSLVIKGHPANIVAMSGLKEIFSNYKSDSEISSRIFWVDDVSIHQLLQSCLGVFTVNSGVGIEAILHYKRVFTFGYSDYASNSTKIVYGGSLENATKSISYHLNNLLNMEGDGKSKLEYIQNCHGFIEGWYKTHVDCNDSTTFKKLLSIF